MCGLTGFLEREICRSRDESTRTIQRMTDSLRHRGPDDGDIWLDEAGKIALGHRRLSIIDTSESGRQPMRSRCGRFVIVYNGEIYNHIELRSELESRGHTFRGTSDTETLLEAVSEWGVEKTLKRCIGMFAFGVWDETRRILTLGRDRIGIKPLYYARPGGSFLFASELKALRCHPSFRAEVNRSALAGFVQHNCVHAPHTIYDGVFKLPAGSLLEVSGDARELPEPETWWDIHAVAESARDSQFTGTPEAALDQLENLLSDAVRLRMISDVPLGAFLSGGIDSSLVVALMQKQSGRPVRTFTIGFDEEGYNEATHAKAVADHLGTDHTELYVTPQQARDVIPMLPTLYDEPFADSSQISTFLVSQLARQHVTVALSGDGGDELFGGYNRYFHLRDRWQQIARIPARRQLAPMLRTLAKISPGRWSDRFGYRASLLGTESASSLYQQANLHWPYDSTVVLDAGPPSTIYRDHDRWLHSGDPIEEWMWIDSATYLPDDILVKVDRACMAVGLEARVPILDHRIFEFAWSLPQHLKVAGNEGKLPLRRILSRYIPSELFERPKMGFGVPIDVWLRGPLRDWAESLLDEKRLRDEGFFNPDPIRAKWNDHLSGRADWHYHLWDILMFQSWAEEFVV